MRLPSIVWIDDEWFPWFGCFTCILHGETLVNAPFCSRSSPTLTKMQPERVFVLHKPWFYLQNLLNLAQRVRRFSWKRPPLRIMSLLKSRRQPTKQRVLKIFAGFLRLAAGKHQLLACMFLRVSSFSPQVQICLFISWSMCFFWNALSVQISFGRFDVSLLSLLFEF